MNITFPDLFEGDDAPGLGLSDELLDVERKKGAVLRLFVPGVADVLLAESVAIALLGELAWWGVQRGATVLPSGRVVAPLIGPTPPSSPTINWSLVLAEVPTEALKGELARRSEEGAAP